jgi:alpha-tubulin suppressor-like RCC1 family protein
MLLSTFRVPSHRNNNTQLLNRLYETYLVRIRSKRTCESLTQRTVYCHQYQNTYSMSTATTTTESKPTTTKKQQHLYMWGTNKSGTILTPSSALQNTKSASSTDSTNTATTTATATATAEQNLNVPTLIATLPDPTFLSSSNDISKSSSFTTATTTNTNSNITVSKVICGPTETAVILSNGLCYVSGRNAYGQLGIGQDKKDPVITPVCINRNFPYYNENDNIPNEKAIVHDVAFGTNFAAYLVVPPNAEDRITPTNQTKEIIGYDLYTCGFGGSTLAGVGCLGHGDIQHRTTPTLVQSLYEDNVYVQQVVAGDAHCTILTTEHEILTTGSGSYGRLGNFDTTDQLYFEPVEIALNTLITIGTTTNETKNQKNQKKLTNHIIQIAGGKSFTLALSYDGIIYGWGRNHKGQLGTGLGLAVDMYAMQSVPEPIDTADLSQKKVIKIAAGHSHAACITDNGELYFWGMSLHLEPVLVTSLLHTKIVDVVCGHDYTLAIDMNGHMYSFGSGTNILGHGKDIKHLNEPKMITSIQTGSIDTNDDDVNKTGTTTSIQRKVVYASAGWQHAACLIEEEEQIV